jgi:hypothetical protein
MATARDARGSDERVVAVIGDGSLTAGLAFESLNQAGHLKKNLLVILNDNEMSISPNVGALSSFFSRQLTSDFFVRLKRETEHFLDSVPKIGKDLRRLAKKAEEAVKGFLTPGMLFEAFDFDYVGPIDGHKLDELIPTLENITHMDGPVLMHVVTRKGKGFPPAEENPHLYHGVGPFDPVTGPCLARPWQICPKKMIVSWRLPRPCWKGRASSLLPIDSPDDFLMLASLSSMPLPLQPAWLPRALNPLLQSIPHSCSGLMTTSSTMSVCRSFRSPLPWTAAVWLVLMGQRTMAYLTCLICAISLTWFLWCPETKTICATP